MQSFQQFLKKFLDVWNNSSIEELKEIISFEYQAREISQGKIIDFGYEESINGWEQGFQYVKQANAKWDVKELSVLSLRADEMLVILSASLNINGKSVGNANLFFQTFKKEGESWKLVRSYIEAEIPLKNLSGDVIGKGTYAK